MEQQGTRVGRYELRSVLGRGGMGVVYEAVLHGPAGFRKEVALKVLDPDRLEAQGDARDSLVREARLGAMLSHPNLVSTLELGEFDGQWFVAMELVRGASVSQIARSAPIPPAAVLDIGVQLCAGLAHVHALRVDGAATGLVHRDVKLRNLLLDRTGLVKLGDLGIARLATEAGTDAAGTLGYMAPEQLDGLADPRSDLFGVGVALYVMAARRRPFGVGADAIPATLGVEASLADPAFLAPVEKAVPGLADIVRRALRADPALRWSSAAALGAALRAIQPHQEPGPPLATLLAGVRPDLEPESGASLGSGSDETTLRLPSVHTAGRRLPRPTDAYIDRGQAETALRLALDRNRMVSVIGAGGTGKTRTVLEVLQRHPDVLRVVFCDAVAARTSDDLTAAAADALGLELVGDDPTAQVATALAARNRAVLVIDAVEGAAATAGPLLQRWLDAAPELSVVCTSRTPLRVASEERVDLGTMTEAEALALFAARSPSPPTDLDAVRQLVAELDLLPLAVELAAARTRVLGVHTLLARLGDRFHLLTASRRDRPDRHSTLRAAIDASWDLLGPWEQTALSQLSVFVSGFTLQSAEQVLDLTAFPDAPWTLDVLEALLDHSLLRYDAERDRFQLLRSVRLYAAERLEAEGEAPRMAAERRHGELYARMASAEALAALRAEGGVERRRALGAEVRDLQAAAQRALDRDDLDVAADAGAGALAVLENRGTKERALHLATILVDALVGTEREALLRKERAEIHRVLGHRDEAEADLNVALHIATEPRLRARLVLSQAELHMFGGDLEQAAALVEKALDLSRQVGDPELIGDAQGALGIVLRRRGRLDEAREQLEAAIATHRRAGRHVRVAALTNTVGNVHRVQGRMAAARRAYEQALSSARADERTTQEAVVLANLATLAVELGRPADARLQLDRALSLYRRMGHARGEASTLSTLALTHDMLGEHDEAEAAYLRAIELYEAMRSLQDVGTALANLGLMYVAMGDLHRAEPALLRAIELNRAQGTPRFEAYARSSVGLLRIAQGRLDESDASFEAAIEILHGLHDVRGIAAVRAEQARLALLRGHTPAAKGLLDAALPVLRRIDDHFELAKALATAAEVAHAERRHDEAHDHLRAAEALLAATGAGPHSEIGERVAHARQSLAG